MQVKNAGSFYRVRQFLFLLLLVGSFLVFTTPTQAAGIVSGTVHNDVNNDGFYTPGTDFAVDGVTVELQPYGGGAPVNTTVTSSGGAFQFIGVPTNANYRIVVKSDISYVSANYNDFTLAAGADNTGGELLIKGLGGSISGFLFEDLNRNGNFDDGIGVGSVQIHLRQGTSATSPIVSTIYTKPDGSYTFLNLPSGVAYVITADDSDLDFLGKAVVTSSDSASTRTPIPMLKISSVGGSLTGKNLAVTEINPDGIDGIVVLDQNGDNTYIPGEDGLIAGATITLYYEDEVTVVPGVAPVVSLGNGVYKVPSVPLWKYKLKISSLAGYISTGVSPSSAVVSGKPQVIAVDVSVAAPYSAHNFYVKGDPTDPTKSGISGHVFGYDASAWSTLPGPDGGGTANNTVAGTRFANVTVSLYNSSNVLVYTQKTKTDGSYAFSSLAPGSYTAKISKTDTDANYSAYVFMNDTDGKSPTPLGGGPAAAPYEITTTLVAGTPKSLQNFWFGRSNLGRIGVRPYTQNTNGTAQWNSLVNGINAHGAFTPATYSLIQEDGSKARNQDGTEVADITTTGKGTNDGGGSIHFSSQVVPGSYRIIPTSYDATLTYQNPSTYYRTNTNASENYIGLYFRGTNNVSGRLYVDLDTNGVYNGDDQLLRQARVRIYKLKTDGTNDYEVARMGTNANGIYNFTYLPDGKYRIVEDDLSIITGGFGSQIIWHSDFDEPAAGSSKSFVVNLSSGTNITDGDIVYRSANTDFIIKGTAYLDIYNNGVLDPIINSYGDGDLKLDGVKIELFEANGTTPVQNGGSDVVVFTDANGAYSISGSFLSTGTYIIKASKTDLNIVNIVAAPGSTRTINLVNPNDLCEDQVFLLQGPGLVGGFRTYDYIGVGGNAGVTSPLGAPLTLYKETSPGTWKSLRQITYKGTYNFYNLEPGSYQVRLSIVTTIVDKDPTTVPGTIEFVVSATDTSKQKYPSMNFIEDSGWKATISGKVWLDANGNGQIDPSDIELTSADIGATSFDIYRTPYFLTAYNDLVPASVIPIDSTVNLSGSTYSKGAVSYGNYLVHINEVALSGQGLQVVNNRKGSVPIATTFTVPGAYPFVNTLATLQVGVNTLNVVDQDFLVKRISPVEISGRVFYDQDYDNASSSDDIGLNEMKVTLKQTGKPDVVQQVSADGYYKFTSLLDGSYTIVLGSVPNDTDMVAAPTSPASYLVAINSGNLVSQENNFWYHKAGEAGIAGSVMVDINNNHLLDVQSDFPSSGVTVNLKQGSTIIKTTTTNSKGAYKFTGIAQDTYVIELVGLPPGYVVYQNASGQSLSSTMTLVMNAGMNSGQWFLLAGDSNTNRGEAPGGVASQKSGISGYLYEGSNATPTANRLAGAVVAIYDGGTLMGSYTTGSDGKYQFYNLSVGSDYQVVLRAAPSGYGIRGDVDATTTAGTIKAPIASSSSNPGKHDQNMWFATLSANGIQGKVFYRADVSPNLDVPVNGITVELYDKNYPPGLNSPISTTTTNSTGAYQFANIATIDYIVKVLDSDKISKNYVDLLPLSPGETTINGLPVAGSLNNNFILNGTQKISGKIWLDDNGDKAYTSGTDLILGPVVIHLLVAGPDGIIGNADDITIRTLTTASGVGTYEFDHLPNDNYRLMIDTTTPLFSGLDLIPVASIAGNVIPRDITLSANHSGVDFGFEYDGSISGTLYQDIDGNGARSTVDSAFAAGVTVTLTNVAGTKTFTTTTLADGTYSFGNVSGDTWNISANPTDYVFSFGEGGTVSGSNVQVVVTSGTTSFTGVNLGYKGTGKIQGKVVLDTNLTDGGQATSVDTPIGAGIKVVLSGSSGFITREVLTNASGEYEITNLSPYTYTVSVDTTAAGFPAGLLVSFDPVHGTTNPANSVSLTILAAMTPLTQKDFGYKGRGEVSGKILVDLEGQGTYRSTHGSFATSLTVTAKQGSITKTTTTNGSGEYSFDSLSTGVWEIYLDTGDIPSGHAFSYGQNATSVTTRGVTIDIDSALLGRSAVLKATNIYLGYRGSASIKGRLVYDNNDTDGATYNGAVDGLFVAGYTVTLQGGSGFTPFTTTTNSSGEYTFSGLTTYADYKVVVANPAGYVFSFDPDSTAVTPPTAPVGNGEAVIPITSPTQTLTNQDFAFKGAGKIAGLIYTDLNDNGTYETGIDLVKTGITVTLTHATLPARTAVTNSTGEYEFTWVAAGTWSAEVTGGLSGVRFPSFDYDDAYTASSSPVTPNKSQIILTASTPIVTDADFGYINRGKLEGVIKEDVAGTSLYDPSAPGIAGVTVHLVEHDGITPKYHLDGVTPIIMTTDSAGKFSIRNLECPLVGELYAVRVEFGPSATGPLATMEPSYDSDVLGTPGYGSGVNVSAGTHMINADLPSTTASQIAQRTEQNLYLGYRAIAGDLVIQKQVAKATAKIGDIIPYTITIENKNPISPALGVVIEDLIPAGFKYVSGSARLDGVKIEDPIGTRPLRFENINLGSPSGVGSDPVKRKLTYFLVIGAGVTEGDYVNTAVAKDSFNQNASNTSSATVQVTADPLFDDSLIFGKVYVDTNKNGIQDGDEKGLGGVKLITGRGEIITTDKEGRYHLPGVSGGRWERGINFILKLDVRSLSKGHKVLGENPTVVRLSPGIPSKIDFRIEEETINP